MGSTACDAGSMTTNTMPATSFGERFRHEDGDLLFVPWHRSRLQELQQLHEDWFPVRYKPAFYDCACQNVVWDSKRALFTAMAIDTRGKPTPIESIDSQIDTTFEHAYPPHSRGAIPRGRRREDERNPQHQHGTGEDADEYRDASGRAHDSADLLSATDIKIGCVVGAVCAQLVPMSECEEQGLVAPTTRSGRTVTHLLYILTLGAVQSYRRRGIGSKLVQLCEQYALGALETGGALCGGMYLHVVTYNGSAVSFYRRQGFLVLREMKDYYVIAGLRYSSKICVRPLNGATPALTWWQAVLRPVTSVVHWVASWVLGDGSAARAEGHDDSGHGHSNNDEPNPPKASVSYAHPDIDIVLTETETESGTERRQQQQQQ